MLGEVSQGCTLLSRDAAVGLYVHSHHPPHGQVLERSALIWVPVQGTSWLRKAHTTDGFRLSLGHDPTAAILKM